MEIFLAAPFTQMLDSKTGRVETHFRWVLEQVLLSLRREGFTVVNAHEREDWGAALMEPQEALQKDVESIAHCDMLVAYQGVPPSPGVQYELGYAHGIKKPAVVLSNSYQLFVHGKKLSFPYLEAGHGTWNRTKIIPIQSLDELCSAHVLAELTQYLCSCEMVLTR